MAGKYPDGRGKPGAPKGCGLTYDEEKVADILKRVQNGESVRQACDEVGIPPGTFHGWVVADEPRGIAARYARANEAKMLLMAQEILEISDDNSGDVHVDKDGSVRNVSDNVQRAKLRVDTRKWIMARMGQNFFSETRKHELSGPGGGPIETTELTVEERKRRLKELGLPVDVLED